MENKYKIYIIKLIAKRHNTQSAEILLDLLYKEKENETIIGIILDYIPILDGIDYYSKVKFIENFKSFEICKKLIRFYGRAKCEEAEIFLKSIIKNQNYSIEIRRLALKSLGDLENEGNLRLFLSYLDNNEKEMVKSALYACGKMKTRNILPYLQRFNNSTLPEDIQIAVIEAYYLLGISSELVKYFYYYAKSPKVKIEILNYLIMLDPEQSKKTLKKLLDSNDQLLRLSGLRGLQKIGDYEALEYILNYFFTFPAFYQHHLVNIAVSIAEKFEDKVVDFVKKRYLLFFSKYLASFLNSISNPLFSDTLVKILRVSKKETIVKDIAQFNKMIREIESEDRSNPFFIFHYLIEYADNDIIVSFLDFLEKKYIYRKERFPKIEEIIFYTKIITNAKIKGCKLYACFMLIVDNVMVVSEILKYLFHFWESSEEWNNILKYLYNKNNDTYKELILDIVTKHKMKGFLSYVVERFNNENLRIKSKIIYSLGRIGLKNNIYIIRELMNYSDKYLIIACLKAMGFLHETDEKLEKVSQEYIYDIEVAPAIIQYYTMLSKSDKVINLLDTYIKEKKISILNKIINTFFDIPVTNEINTKIIELLFHENDSISKIAFNYISKRIKDVGVLISYYKI